MHLSGLFLLIHLYAIKNTEVETIIITQVQLFLLH